MVNKFPLLEGSVMVVIVLIRIRKYNLLCNNLLQVQLKLSLFL